MRAGWLVDVPLFLGVIAACGGCQGRASSRDRPHAFRPASGYGTVDYLESPEQTPALIRLAADCNPCRASAVGVGQHYIVVQLVNASGLEQWTITNQGVFRVSLDGSRKAIESMGPETFDVEHDIDWSGVPSLVEKALARSGVDRMDAVGVMFARSRTAGVHAQVYAQSPDEVIAVELAANGDVLRIERQVIPSFVEALPWSEPRRASEQEAHTGRVQSFFERVGAEPEQ